MSKIVSLISINSPQELTGGGHYLRSLINGYESLDVKLNVIAKKSKDEGIKFDDKTTFNFFKKNIWSDIISRLFLSPTFLLYYVFVVISRVKCSDVISLHSSRLGVFAFLFKILFPSKKIICHFDNVEKILLGDLIRKPNVSVKYIVCFFDYLIIGLSEKLCIKFSDHCTFITGVDSKHFSYHGSIIPICYPVSVDNDRLSDASGGYFLFTGSFDFEPNIDALRQLISFSLLQPEVSFLVAGRNLANLDLKVPSNVVLIDSPNVKDMQNIFINAKGYISTVRLGSGMKTKIAEAMKYGLPVYATDNSLVGYDDVVNKPYILNFKDLKDLCSKFSEQAFNTVVQQEIFDDFVEFYSIKRVQNELARLI